MCLCTKFRPEGFDYNDIYKYILIYLSALAMINMYVMLYVVYVTFFNLVYFFDEITFVIDIFNAMLFKFFNIDCALF